MANGNNSESESVQELFFPSPMMQFKSGISTYDVKCDRGLTLMIKSSNGYPACIKPNNETKLIKRGWARNLTISTSMSLPLRLYLFTNTTNMYPEQAIEINASVNNTFSKPFLAQKQEDWGFDVLAVRPCFHTSVEITILEGYYTQNNMTGVKQMPIYRPTLCPVVQNFIKSYEFQPLSNQAKIVEYVSNTGSTHSGIVAMEYHDSLNGTWASWDTHNPFDPGTYTIVGGDEWGHIAIQHFEVINPLKSR